MLAVADAPCAKCVYLCDFESKSESSEVDRRQLRVVFVFITTAILPELCRVIPEGVFFWNEAAVG